MPARIGYNGFSANRREDLVAVLRWLRPGTRIAMGPAGYLNNRL